jgi:hypothetical protein
MATKTMRPSCVLLLPLPLLLLLLLAEKAEEEVDAPRAMPSAAAWMSRPVVVAALRLLRLLGLFRALPPSRVRLAWTFPRLSPRLLPP